MDGNTEKLNTSTEEYIDKQYENAREFELKKEIMEEVKSYIRDAVRTEFEVQKMTLEDSFKLDRSVQPDYSEFLQHLKKEIDFMRKQIENRDELINSFLTQKTVATETSHKKQEKDFQENQNIFKKPKKTAKAINHAQNDYVPFTNTNRYESLFDENNDNDNENNDVSTAPKQSDNFHTSSVNNVTKRKKKQKISPTNDKNKKRVVAIIGDSMLKHVKGYKLSNKESKVVVKTFPGAKTSCMEHYMIPTLDQKPDVVILHCGTNDLKNQQPEEVCKNIVNLGKEISRKSENTSVVISGIVPRGDDLNENVVKVNEFLEIACNDCNIGFIDNSNIDNQRHLNNSRLHLNVHGTLELEKNLRNVVNC